MSEIISNQNHVEFYDKTATNKGKQFNLWTRGLCYEMYYLPRLLEWEVFPSQGNVTEVGCGMGHKLEKTRQALDPWIQITGIEASKPLLKAGLEKHPKLKNLCRVDNAFTLETLKDQSQDVMMYYQILHHFDAQEIEQAIKTAKKKLKNKGKIVIIDTFNMEDKPLRKQWFNIIEPIYAILASRSKTGKHSYHNQPKDHFIHFMEAHGFKQIHKTEDEMPYIISEMIVFEKIDS